MTLTLRAVSLNDHPLTQPITVHFDARGGSIGRADHNTMALPDPKRHISRQQAEVTTVGSAFEITNVGSANPIVVGSRALARGESAALAQGDRLRIGGYLLEVEVGASAAAETIVRGRAAVDTTAPPAMRPHEPAATASAPLGAFGEEGEAPLSPGNPFASLFDGEAAPVAPPRVPGSEGDAPLPAGNPFASLFGGEAAAPGPKPPRGGAARAVADDAGSAASAGPPDVFPPPVAALPPSFAAAPPPAAGWSRLPDDFDPFAPPPPAAPPAASPSPSVGVFGDLIPGTEPGSIDDFFGLGGGKGAGSDPLAGFLDAPAPPAAGRRAASPPLATDPLALFGPPGRAAPPPDGRPTASDHVPPLQSAFAPPRLARPAAAPTPTQATAPTLPPKASGAAPDRAPPPHEAAPDRAAPPHEATPDRAAPSAWAAFCEGAGVHLERPAGGDAESMREIGAVLRAAIDGTLRLMAVRASAKHELHAPVTVIQPRHNNPLKFSPDANAALEQLLRPPVRGFLPAPAAVRDAMDDLVGHAIGTLAGTRAALEGVLDRFAPQQLESKLAARSVLDSVLPMNRKARLWELYLQHFETIRGEAQDDFHSLFGRAFLAAYEQQLEQLQGR